MAGSDGSQRSGVSPWLVGLIGYGLYRRGRRAGGRSTPRSGRTSAAPARMTQVEASLFGPDPTSDEQWQRVGLDGYAATQDALALTVGTVGDPSLGADDVPVVLVPLGTRRRVNAVDAYATGGRLGSLPERAVRAIGQSLRATQVANGRPCAVPGRIRRDATGHWTAEVLLPEVFEPSR